MVCIFLYNIILFKGYIYKGTIICYLVWELGKFPEVCLEIVSNQEGNELTLCRKSQQMEHKVPKKDIYALIGIPYYVVFDPLQQIQTPTDMNGALLRVWSIFQTSYIELTPLEGITELGQSIWLERVGLGLTLWSGKFEEDQTRLWLRWCDRHGQVIPTGAESTQIERQRADKLAERLRLMGIDPEGV
jgi:hypothetical protein